MPSANRLSTPVAVNEPEIEGRYAQLDDYTVSFESFPRDVDPSPYFAGLPDDRCQCPHWGLVTAGQLTFRWPDHEETYVAGDAYHAAPGHLPLMSAGSAIVEFSRTIDLEATMAVVGANLDLVGAGTAMSSRPGSVSWPTSRHWRPTGEGCRSSTPNSPRPRSGPTPDGRWLRGSSGTRCSRRWPAPRGCADGRGRPARARSAHVWPFRRPSSLLWTGSRPSTPT